MTLTTVKKNPIIHPNTGGGFMGGHVFYHAPAKRCYVSIPFNGKQEKFWEWKGLPIWDKRTGQKMLSVMQADIDKGTFDPRTYRPDSPLSVKEFSKIWLDAADITKNTKKIYRNAIKKVMDDEGFGENFDIRNFTHSKLLAFKNSLQLSESAKYNVLTSIKTMLRFYKKDVPSFIMPEFPPLAKPEPETTIYLTYEEQERRLLRIPERHRPIFIIMMEYGCRPQEATALKTDCVTEHQIIFKRSHSEYELRETTKTGTKGVRIEDITTTATEALKSARRWPSFQGWIFSHNNKGSHYNNKILNKIWRESYRDGDTKIGLYEAVRHSLGCQLADEGYSIDFIQDVYKHTSIKTTRRYAKRQRGMISKALENRGKVIEIRSSLEVGNKK